MSRAPGATGWRRLFQRKSVAQLRAEAEAAPLRRTLSRTDLTVLGVGAVVGSGIFVLPGIVAAKFAGPAVVFCYLIAGVAASLAALCYAEFSSLTPVSGSAYTYAYATLGEMLAWVIGWGLLLEYTLGAATVAIGWASYVTGFVQRATGAEVATAMHVHVAAVLVTIASTAILCAGIRTSTYATAVFVLIKIAVILLFVFFGAPFITPSNWHPFIPAHIAPGRYGISGVFRGASILFVAFIGFDTITTAAQEARDPQRDVPAGIFGALTAAAVIYAAVAIVLTGLVRYDQLEVPNPVAAAIAVTGVRWVGYAVELGAIAGLSSVLIVIMLGQARILLAMSRDRLLPRALGRVHPGTGAPVVGTIATGIAVIALSMLGSLDALAELVSIGTFLALMMVCIGIPVLRHTDPELPRSFRVPGSPIVPLLGAAACMYLMLALPHQTWALAGIWFVFGLLIYFGNVAFRSRNAV